MISLKNLASLSLVFVLGACGTPSPSGDAGSDAARGDAATSNPDSSTTNRDASSGSDGAMSSDRCATDMASASSTVGCNGGFRNGMPAMNTPGGTCTGGGMAMPQGSCGANMECSADMGMMGFCFQNCMPGATYVSTGGCPTGSRCFDLGGPGACFIDCDAMHPCPNGLMCDNEGSCVPPQAMKAR